MYKGMTTKQFFFNPITLIIGSIIILGIIYAIGYNKYGWFGGALSRSKKSNPNAKGMGGVCAGTDEAPSWLFGCYFAYKRAEAKEQKLIDDCVKKLIAQDPEGDFPVEGLERMCKQQISGGTYTTWQTGDDGENPQSNWKNCLCDGKSRHWLLGCLRCSWR